MLFIRPFKDGSCAGEAGNMLLITGIIASAVAVAGGKVMLDRSTAQRKANQMAQSMKQSKEIPQSAAMIAKALLSLPPHVARDTGNEWTTDKLVNVADNMPLIYPTPYASGAIGSPAQPASSVDKTRNPPQGANWSDYKTDAGTLSSTVKVYTNDRTQTGAQDVNRVMGSQSVTGGSEVIKRTESRVTYVFRNCDSNGKTSSSFTGIYCASAKIKSDNYAGPLDAQGKPTTVNEAIAELGVIEPPPAPACGSFTPPSQIKPGDSFSLGVTAKGVIVGYEIKHAGKCLVDSMGGDCDGKGMVSRNFPWNRPNAGASYTITGISTSKVSKELGDLIGANINQATFDVVLKGVAGRSISCSTSINLPGPVSCVPDSFTVERIGPDERTCRFRLQKDNGEGSVTSITVTSQNTSTGAAPTSRVYAPAFSGNTWTQDADCNANPRISGEDSFNFSASLSRSVDGVIIPASQCSPSPIITELNANCVANSLDGGRDPKDPTKCNITLKREANSHSVVTVKTTPAFLSGSASWPTQNSDKSWNWQGVISPCPLGSVTVTASLTRGSTADSCGTKTISGVEPAKCNGPPTGERDLSDPARCRLSVNKFLSSGPIKHVTINGTIQDSSGNWPGDSWTSPWFACPVTATDYDLALVGLNDVPSSCGTFTMPKVSHTLTTSVTGNGSISTSPFSPPASEVVTRRSTWTHGSTVTLTATPATGYRFVNWSGACSGTSNTCTVTMDSNKSVVANFVINTYTLITSVTGSGTISRTPNATSYNHGSTVTLTATPAAGHKLESWVGACSGTSNICNVVMDSDKSVTVLFASVKNVCSVSDVRVVGSGCCFKGGVHTTKKTVRFPSDATEIRAALTKVGHDDRYPRIKINGNLIYTSEWSGMAKTVNILPHKDVSEFFIAGDNTFWGKVTNHSFAVSNAGNYWTIAGYFDFSYKTSGACLTKEEMTSP